MLGTAFLSSWVVLTSLRPSQLLLAIRWLSTHCEEIARSIRLPKRFFTVLLCPTLESAWSSSPSLSSQPLQTLRESQAFSPHWRIHLFPEPQPWHWCTFRFGQWQQWLSTDFLLSTCAKDIERLWHWDDYCHCSSAIGSLLERWEYILRGVPRIFSSQDRSAFFYALSSRLFRLWKFIWVYAIKCGYKIRPNRIQTQTCSTWDDTRNQ